MTDKPPKDPPAKKTRPPRPADLLCTAGEALLEALQTGNLKIIRDASEALHKAIREWKKHEG